MKMAQEENIKRQHCLNKELDLLLENEEILWAEVKVKLVGLAR